ncbi:transcriptional regulator [Streptococcus suis]|nr:transcriptional regulator [Streptococcus suis]
MNERFWDNLEIILAEKDLTWAELARKVFNGQYVYPSEFNRLYQKLRHYKANRLMPQTRWVERIVLVLDIDYEDLFKR